MAARPLQHGPFQQGVLQQSTFQQSTLQQHGQRPKAPDMPPVQRTSIREERLRLVRTRRLLQAALTKPDHDCAEHWAEDLAFYQACIGYLEIATKRLIAQDIALIENLRPLLPKDRIDDHGFLDELEEQLRARERQLAGLTLATNALSRRGVQELHAFRDAVTQYFALPPAGRTRPMHSLPPLIERFGTAKTWTKAQAAAERCGSEIAAFRVVEARMLPGLDVMVAAAAAQEQQRPQA
ncbi:MAG: hypothetical protein JNM81_10755 [Rhodospirillaceae bacterium]|nr:hypothetical protein [Rhodospirillaceae bacterium]